MNNLIRLWNLREITCFDLYIFFQDQEKKLNADTETRTQVSDLQDQCNNPYTIPA
jgi:hypothetical protein